MADAMQTEDFPYLPSGLVEVNKMIHEYGDLFSDTQCKVCSAVLISESQKLTHYQSKKHANKVRRYLSIQKMDEMEPAVKKTKTPSSSDMDCNNGQTDRFKVCHVCNMTFTSAVMAESHYQGKVHTKNLRLKTVGPQIQTPQTAGAHLCEVCNMTFSSPETAASHYQGKVHAKNLRLKTQGPTIPPFSQTTGSIPQLKLKKKAAPPQSSSSNDNPDSFCNICQASFNNPLMAQQHYAGKKHKKTLTKLKLLQSYGPATAPGPSPASTAVKGYPCTLCNIELNSMEQYQAHIAGAKHKNKTQGKKPGVRTAKNQHAAAETPFVGEENQYAAENTPYAAEDSHYDTPYTTEDNQYAADDAGENQYGAGGDQFEAGDGQYEVEDNRYTKEY